MGTALKIAVAMASRFFGPSARELERQFQSRSLVRPRLSHQRAWAERFAPALDFRPAEGAWSLLQKFTRPLTERYATRAHRRGLAELGLDRDVAPDFSEFAERVAARTGWQIVAAHDEIAAADYFRFLAERKFPCIAALRPVDQVLCGSRPDFWHEAVGHLAPLVDSEISEFYQKCAALHVSLISRGEIKRAHDLEKLLWVVFEYGLLADRGEIRAFGAALAGSFVALTKWSAGQWVVRDFDIEAILGSGLFEEDRDAERDDEGRLVFYVMPSLESTYRMLAEFAETVCEVSLI